MWKKHEHTIQIKVMQVLHLVNNVKLYQIHRPVAGVGGLAGHISKTVP